MNKVTQYGSVGVGFGAGTLGADYLRGADAGTSLVDIGAMTHGVVELVNSTIEKGGELVGGVAETAAPYLFPIIAAGKGARIAAEKYGPDSMWFRNLATVAGGAVGGAAALSIVGKYLAAAGLTYTVIKSPKFVNKVAQKGVGAVVQTVKWVCGDGAKRVGNVMRSDNWGSGANGVYA